MRTVIFILWLVCYVGGFVCASYGVLREAFSATATQVGFGEGRFGEGSFGGGLTGTEKALVTVGVKLGLLPADRVLTVTDRKKNAALAIAGVLLLGMSIVLDLVHRSLPR